MSGEPCHRAGTTFRRVRSATSSRPTATSCRIPLAAGPRCPRSARPHPGSGRSSCSAARSASVIGNVDSGAVENLRRTLSRCSSSLIAMYKGRCSARPRGRTECQRVFVDVITAHLKQIQYASDGIFFTIRVPGYDHAEVVADPKRAFGAPIFKRGGARVGDVLRSASGGGRLDRRPGPRVRGPRRPTRRSVVSAGRSARVRARDPARIRRFEAPQGDCGGVVMGEGISDRRADLGRW